MPLRYRKTPPNAVASYAPASQGPFVCSNCEYQKRLYCEKPEVVREAQQLRGLAKQASVVLVEGNACCNFHELTK